MNAISNNIGSGSEGGGDGYLLGSNTEFESVKQHPKNYCNH